MRKIRNFYKVAFLTSIFAISMPSCSQKDKKADEMVALEEADVLDSESIYQLPGEWRNQDDEALQLTDLHGKIPVMSMVFTHCGYACPRIIADMQNIEEQVPKDKKDKVVFVLISFDTERDTPKRLKSYAHEMNLGENWMLLHGDEEEVRALSMLLDIKYKKQPNGDFAHSNSITLLNTKGVIMAKVEGLGANPQPILAKLKEM